MSKQTPSTWDVLKSVLASFFGVQKEETRQRDFTHGKPSQFIIIGLVLTVALIGILYIAAKVALSLALG